MQPAVRAGFLEEARLSSLNRSTAACVCTRSSRPLSPARQGHQRGPARLSGSPGPVLCRGLGKEGSCRDVTRAISVKSVRM